ncbi:MAG TPA: hypothetical protein VG205_10460 [Acidimicrobiales bacterium]|nr:hypothetical protein [Acidimicrobiales bacterium]
MSADARVTVRPGDRDHETEVYLSSTVSGPVGVSGVASLDAVTANPDGSRVALVAPTGEGVYLVRVAWGAPGPGPGEPPAIEPGSIRFVTKLQQR